MEEKEKIEAVQEEKQETMEDYKEELSFLPPHPSG